MLKPVVVEYEGVQYRTEDVGVKLAKDYNAKCLMDFRVDLKTNTALFRLQYKTGETRVIPINFKHFKI